MARWRRWRRRGSTALLWLALATATVALAVYSPTVLAFALMMAVIWLALIRAGRPYS